MPYSAIARAAMYGDRTGFVKKLAVLQPVDAHIGERLEADDAEQRPRAFPASIFFVLGCAAGPAAHSRKVALPSTVPPT